MAKALKQAREMAIATRRFFLFYFIFLCGKQWCFGALASYAERLVFRERGFWEFGIWDLEGGERLHGPALGEVKRVLDCLLGVCFCHGRAVQRWYGEQKERERES